MWNDVRFQVGKSGAEWVIVIFCGIGWVSGWVMGGVRGLFTLLGLRWLEYYRYRGGWSHPRDKKLGYNDSDRVMG